MTTPETSPIAFDRDFDPLHGEPVPLSPLVRRVTANNANPFTFRGTNAYLVGAGEDVAVIDPGPEDPNQIEAILSAVGDARVSAIVVTHTHRDHSPNARALQARTGAPVVGAGAHRAARPLAVGEANPLDAAADLKHAPDRQLRNGETVEGDGWTLTAVETPGHTANHLAFALAQENALFSGDHVMAWATTVVAPPDGSMRDYMASLDVLLEREEAVYWPGHGGPVHDPRAYVRALKAHRKMRERAILERLSAGDTTIPAIVAAIYRETPKALHGAAALSTLAQLEDLVARGLAESDRPPSLDARFARS